MIQMKELVISLRYIHYISNVGNPGSIFPYFSDNVFLDLVDLGMQNVKTFPLPALFYRLFLLLIYLFILNDKRHIPYIL